MTLAKAESLLSAELIESSRAAGRAYGENEAELLADQGIDPTTRDWTDGAWCGENPAQGDEQRDAYETVLDSAARQAFDAFDLDDYRARNPHASV